MSRSQAIDWLEMYKQRNALWRHDGNPKRPHVRLHAGDHSNGFFNSEVVIENVHLANQACAELCLELVTAGLNCHLVDRVVGPAMGAIDLATLLALNASVGRESSSCLRGYTEKDPPSKEMVFRKTLVRPGEKVLCVEDVITTGDSVSKTRAAIVKAGGVPFPFVATLVNRSGLQQIDESQIVALVNLPMENWAPADCPLCRQGSKALYPAKKVENWARLNADY